MKFLRSKVINVSPSERKMTKLTIVILELAENISSSLMLIFLLKLTLSHFCWCISI